MATLISLGDPAITVIVLAVLSFTSFVIQCITHLASTYFYIWPLLLTVEQPHVSWAQLCHCYKLQDPQLIQQFQNQLAEI